MPCRSRKASSSTFKETTMDEQTVPPPAPPPQAQPQQFSTMKQTSSLAIASLISGILGWTLLPWVGSIVAIITGHMARAEIRRNPDTMEGDGLAIAGLVLGWAVVIFSLLTLIAIMMFFGGLAMFLAWLGATGQLH
jgi:hypothetical protein